MGLVYTDVSVALKESKWMDLRGYLVIKNDFVH